jgi:hypothetical protein
MEPVQIAARVACTKDLRFLGREARELEYDRLLPREIDDQLDPNGNHLLFPRPDGLALSDTREAPPNRAGYTTVSSLSLSLQDSIPCEVLAKLRGKKEATHFMLDVSLENMMKMKTLDEARVEQGLHPVFDGEHKGNR